MKLSEVHKELLDSVYPDGYVAPEGEEGYFHVMFVDIVKNKGKRTSDKAVFQKFFPVEWQKIKAVIDNPVYGILVTGHDEYAIVHYPTKKKAEQGKAEDEVKPEAKHRPGPKPKTP